MSKNKIKNLKYISYFQRLRQYITNMLGLIRRICRKIDGGQAKLQNKNLQQNPS